MKELRLSPHTVHPHRQTIEIVEDDVLLGTITQADDGIRILSKHKLEVTALPDDPRFLTAEGKVVHVVQVRIEMEEA
jgi:hypothetical protein